MRKRLGLFVFIAVMLGLLASPFTIVAQEETPSGGLEISPPVVELKADPGQTVTTTIKLRNIATGVLIATPEVNDFIAQGEEGQPKVLLEDDEAETSRFSLKTWVAPIDEIRLEENEQKPIQVTFNVPADAEPGSHWGVVRFTAAPPDAEGEGSKVALSASIGALVFLNVSGDVTQKLSFIEMFASRDGKRASFFENGPLAFTERLKNEGTVHLRPTGTLEIKNLFGKKVASLPVNEGQRLILPESIRKFEQKLDKKWLFGRYTATLDLAYGDPKVGLGKQSINFWVMPYRVIGLIILLLFVLYLVIRSAVRRYNRYIIDKAGK